MAIVARFYIYPLTRSPNNVVTGEQGAALGETSMAQHNTDVTQGAKSVSGEGCRGASSGWRVDKNAGWGVGRVCCHLSRKERTCLYIGMHLLMLK